MTQSSGVPTLSTASLSAATIMDLGSYQIKVGEAADTRPAHALYSYGAMKENAMKPEENMLYNCQSRPIIQNGQVADLDGLEMKLRVLQRNYYPNMFGQALSLLQPYYCNAAERQQLAELLFEKFNAKAIHFGVQEAAAVMGAGCTTGMCCDFGFGKTSTVPVVDGRALESAGAVCYLNGQVLGSALVQEARKQSKQETSKLDAYCDSLSNFGLLQLGSDALQFFCSVSETALDPLQFEFQTTSRLALPDGAFVEVGRAAQLLPESFFNTAVFELFSQDQPGQNFAFQSIQYQFVQSIIGQPAQVRRELVQNVVLAGGVSQMAGLQTRLRAELDAVYSIQALTGKPRLVQHQIDRRDLSFFGGAVIASLSVFGYFVSSAQEWKEEGAVGVERRRM